MKSNFFTMLSSDDFSKLIMEKENLNMLVSLIPELKNLMDFEQNNPHHAYDAFMHTVHALENCEIKNDATINLALLLHDVGKPYSFQDGPDGIRHFIGHDKASAEIAEKILNRLDVDEQTKKNIVDLVQYHDTPIEPNKKNVNKWLNKIGETQLERLIEIKKADIKGQKPDYEKSWIDSLDEVKPIIEEVIKENSRFTAKSLAVNGGDLIQAGFKPGKELGEALQSLVDAVVDGKVKNEKEELLNFAQYMQKENNEIEEPNSDAPDIEDGR